MNLTIDWIATTFAKFNCEYFNNELPTPRFLIVQSDKILGQCGAKHWRTHPDFFIKLSNLNERTEYQYQCTLLHEMIHLYWQSKGEWNVHHGKKFVDMAMRFKRMGWDLPMPKNTKKKSSRTKDEISRYIKDRLQSLVNKETNNNITMTEQDKEYAVYAQASVRWENVWCTQSSTGVVVHCYFRLYKMKNVPCKLKVSVYSDMIPIKELVIHGYPSSFEQTKLLEPVFDPTVYTDLSFEIPYSVFCLEDDSLISKMMFRDEGAFNLQFSIIYNDNLLACLAFHKIRVLAEKKIFGKIKYSITEDDFVYVPMNNNGECNDPDFIDTTSEKIQEPTYNQAPKEEGKETPAIPEINPLSKAMRELLNLGVLSDSDEKRVIMIESEVKNADSQFNIQWNDVYIPNADYPISSALMKLVDMRCIKDSLRVKHLMASLRKKRI